MKNLKSLVILTIILLSNPLLVKAEYMRKKDDLVPNVYVAKIRSDKKIYDYMYIPKRASDNQFVYCLEPGIHINEDEEYKDYVGNFANLTNLTSNQMNRVKTIIFYGYGYKNDSIGINHTDKKWYAATQSLLWDINSNGFDIYFTSYLQGPKITPFENERKEILDLVDNHPVTPDFKINNDLIAGERVNLVDYNSVLKYYNVSTSNTNISILNKSGNNLLIEGNTPGKTDITFTKKNGNFNSGFHLYKLNGSQTLISPGDLDNVRKKITVNVVAGSVKINKIDSDSKKNIPQGMSSLEGAKYFLIDNNGKTIDTLITNKNGEASSKNILKINENYYLKEIVPSRGYELDTNVYPINVTRDNLNIEMNLEEKVIKNEIEIRKMIKSENGVINEPEANIIFDIYLKNSDIIYDSIQTNHEGIADTVLPYGNYIIKQRNTTNNFAKSEDFEVSITNKYNNKLVIELDDMFQKIKLKVSKKDIDSDRLITNLNFRFKIKDIKNNEYICPSNDNCFYETKDGVFITDELFDIGEYQIEELEDKDSIFEFNPQKVVFNIGKDFSDNIIEVDFFNKIKNGTISIEKLSEEPVINNNIIEYEWILKDNVEFSLFANKNITTFDGKVIYKKDEIIDKYKTKNGKISIKNLPLGEYRIEEGKMDNYKSIDPIIIDINGQNISHNIIVKNYLNKTTLKIMKKDSLTKEPISNTNFNIYLSDNLILNRTTDIKGEIIISNIPYGGYLIKEIQASDGFILDDNEYVVNLTSEDDYELVVENERVLVPNTYLNIPRHIPIITEVLYFEDRKDYFSPCISC